MAKVRRQRLPDIHDEMADRGVWDPHEFGAWLDERGWAWQALDRGDYGVSTEEALLAYVFEDPIRWVETFLVEPDTGEPYRLFDYQRESIRAWAQDVIHQDGAEVGKTREIVCLLLWACCTAVGGRIANPWSLVGAPQQTHLDEIILAVEEQMGAQGEHARGGFLSQFWHKPKRTPHTMHRFVAPNFQRPDRPSIARVYYRPAGHDGEAFRGVHVNAFGFMDEAAKLKQKLQWSEFWRALKPGCRSRVYSVPDGDTASDFYALTQRAVPNLPADVPGTRLFHWPKTLMPAPFWSAERDAEMIRRYGGRNTPGYVRNVMGEHGQAENPVWSWDIVLPCVRQVLEYRALYLHADLKARTLSVQLRSVELDVIEGRKAPREQNLTDTTLDIGPFLDEGDATRRKAWQDLIRKHIDPMEGVLWAGGDLGERNDPTELIISRDIGPVMRDQLRVHAAGLPYAAQRELIYAISGLCGHNAHWGIDLGSAGTVIVRDLQTLDAYVEARFDETMAGFQFAGMVDCIGEDGEPLEVETPGGDLQTLRAPAKHWATQCITVRLQAGGYAMAYDTQVLAWMTNHTAREGAKWPIYAKKDDHAIDARRVQMLARLYAESGAVDVFSSGVHQRAA